MTAAEANRRRLRRNRERRHAARIVVDGRPVAPVAADKHGRTSTYSNHGCRCEPCTAAQREYMAKYCAARRNAS